MAHSHAHGEGAGNYFLDQLFTILACGSVGLVAILMYQSGILGRILVPMFFMPVVIAGVAVMLLVAVRAIAVWKIVGSRPVETYDHAQPAHVHTEDCGHDHGQEHSHAHAHAHSHAETEIVEDHSGHDHGWAPWRYMVLAVPVFIFFLGLPRAGLTGWEKDRASSGDLRSKKQPLSMLAGGAALSPAFRKQEQLTHHLPFQELTLAAAIPDQRDIFEGDIGYLRGLFIPMKNKNDREFTLLRVDTTCCVADSVFLETRIIAPDALQQINTEEWVEIHGVISFQQNEKGKWIPVITLSSNDDIKTGGEPTGDVRKY